MTISRELSPIDRALMHFDTALRTLSGNVVTTKRPCPKPEPQAVTEPQSEAGRDEPTLSEQDKQLSGRLMRINHSGEVAAQGLYQGQALGAKSSKVRDQMQLAAQEENDHLAWCQTRAKQLGTHTSLLDPLWYAGAVVIGASAAIAGDKWSLGFVAETEKQVVAHLEEHLEQISPNDRESRAILEQMKIDEGQHATTAFQAGAAELPPPIRRLMKLASKVMTKTTYWI